MMLERGIGFPSLRNSDAKRRKTVRFGASQWKHHGLESISRLAIRLEGKWVAEYKSARKATLRKTYKHPSPLTQQRRVGCAIKVCEVVVCYDTIRRTSFFLKIYYETSSDFENVSENADRALLDRVKVIMNKFVRRTFIILLFPLEIYENELVTKAFDHQIIGLQISVQLNIKYKWSNEENNGINYDDVTSNRIIRIQYFIIVCSCIFPFDSSPLEAFLFFLCDFQKE